jgi:hypothetical protein
MDPRSRLLALVAALASGCAKDALTAMPDAGAPVGNLVVDCPAAAPSTGSTCSDRALDCEYGSDWNPACNTVAQCWRGGPLDGTWQVQAPAGAATPCPTPTVLAAGCPQAAPAPASSCDAVGVLCPYPAGTCLCHETTSSASPPVTTRQWACTGPPGAGCPSLRPRIGSACSHEGLSCNYAVCSVGGGVYCSGGVWSAGLPPNLCSGG